MATTAIKMAICSFKNVPRRGKSLHRPLYTWTYRQGTSLVVQMSSAHRRPLQNGGRARHKRELSEQKSGPTIVRMLRGNDARGRTLSHHP
eukprot:COSAG02_NODE_50328_length_321_cov_0.702703_1_plen_89_part_10